MTCRQTDQLLCDYLDGALPLEQHRAFERHLEECPACSEALADSRLALGFVRRAPAVEPPVELIADIIHDTIGVRGTLPVLAPAGGSAGVFGWLRPFFNPLLQPRFAMSMVMAVLSLSMLTFYAKGALENWTPGQSKPVAVAEHVGDQFKRAWDATTEFFETVRGMYQLQKELATEPEEDVQQAPPQQAEPQQTPSQPGAAAPQAPPQPGRTGGPTPQRPER
jgi:Putative zinc-finger